MNINIKLLGALFALVITSLNVQALEIHGGKLLGSRIEKSPGATGGFFSRPTCCCQTHCLEKSGKATAGRAQGAAIGI